MADLLAPYPDLVTWLGVTGLSLERAMLALETATGWVQDHTGQRLTPVTGDTVTLTAGWPTQELELPERPVTSVTSVTVSGVTYSAASDFTLYQNTLQTGWYDAGRRGRWSYWPQFVTVVYSHGYSTCPQGIRGVILSAAARIIGNPEGHGASSIGGMSFGGAASSGSLSDAEKVSLRNYRGVLAA